MASDPRFPASFNIKEKDACDVGLFPVDLGPHWRNRAASERTRKETERRRRARLDQHSGLAGDLGNVITSALSSWADRFSKGASTVSDQSAVLGKDAARLGTMALDQIGEESRQRPLVAVAVALGVGILLGVAVRKASG
jgi:ElaB/YqjD/DUF883 family membrane-anchored ribosome-binding protein